jgi:hypothetical protein
MWLESWVTMAIDGPGSSAMREDGRANGILDGPRCRGDAMQSHNRDGEAGFEGLHEAAGTNVHSRPALPESRRSVCASMKYCAHGWPRIGGARIGAVRARISMTIIGAPQCRQMKTGRVSMTVSWGNVLTSVATCSSSRTFARLVRRTGLASSP